MAVPPPIFSSSPVHPERGRDYRSNEPPPHVLVIHTSEQPSATTSTAEALARFIAGPPTGTEPNLNISSYHWCVDLDSIVHMQWVLDLNGRNKIAYHAPPNWRGEGICITGRAARDWTGTNDGVDDWPELELTAHLAAWRCEARGWPVRRLTPQQIIAGEKGICGHIDMTNAFHQSDHTDPGVGFPWAWFIQRVKMIQEYWAPPVPPPPSTGDDPLRLLQVYDVPGVPGLIVTGHMASWVPTMEAWNAYLAAGIAPEAAAISWFKTVTLAGPLPPGMTSAMFLAHVT